MKPSTFAPLALAAALAACAPVNAPPPPLTNPLPFSAQEFAWSTQTGANSVEGSVVYTRGGPAWTCAGSSVGLTPDTAYSRQRIGALYGSTRRALLPLREVRSRSVGQPEPEYNRFVRTAKCDAAGRFRFENLPDGAWFVIAPVRPGAGAAPEDALVLMQQVEARGGRAQIVLLQ